jgi:uncharacterized membrane protein YgcG
MKKIAALLVLFALCSVAFALPTPHQIEDALAARDYVSARGMVQQVLSERPDSARAHLFNAFLLEHVDHNVGAARAELQTASGLDKRGDVKGSALFGRVVAEMDAQAATRAVSRPAVDPAPAWAVKPAPVAAPAAAFPLHMFLGILLVIVLIVAFGIWLLRAPASVPVIVTHHHRGYGSAGARRSAPIQPSGGSPGYAHTPVYEPALAPVIMQGSVAPARGGMTAGENFVSTAGGVVAGNVISDALLHHRNYRDDDYESERRRRRDDSSVDSSTAYTPPPAPAVDYASERSSFSSSSSGSDSWGSSSSSSSDFSSSSSSDSSWGSSDSGSSSDSW